MKPSFQLMLQPVKNVAPNQTKSNIKRNLSVNPTKSNSLAQPKSLKRFAEKKIQCQKSYIANSLTNIQNGCIDQVTGQLKIDGGWGDYRMKIYRKKDRVKHYKDPSSIFSDKQFSKSVWDYANSGLAKVQQIQKLVKLNIQQPCSPCEKKAAWNQRVRMGLRRQNSIIYPGLKQVEPQVTQLTSSILPEQNVELTKKINDILSKPMNFYLNKPAQNKEQEEQKNKLRKGIQQQLRQKQGHLFYQSIPRYMAEKWFKTVDNSTPNGNYVTPYVEQKPVPSPQKKNGYKRTHIFRFLQQNCEFNINKKNNSMVTC